MPRSQIEFWQEKFQRNIARDQRQRGELEALGWRVLVIWECELKDEAALAEMLRSVLKEDADVMRC